MDVAAILSDIRRHGFSSVDFPDATLITYINDAYFEICSRETWPFLEDSAAFSLTAGTVDITTPTNINKVIAIIDTDNHRVLRHIRSDDVLEQLPSQYDPTTQGIPRYFYFVGDIPKVHPAPNDTINYRILYVRRPAALAVGGAEATILLPPRHHRLIVNGALISLMLTRDDIELARVFEQQFEKRLLAMREDIWVKTFKPDYIHPTYEEFDTDDYVVYGWE